MKGMSIENDLMGDTIVELLKRIAKKCWTGGALNQKEEKAK